MEGNKELQQTFSQQTSYDYNYFKLSIFFVGIFLRCSDGDLSTTSAKPKVVD